MLSTLTNAYEYQAETDFFGDSPVVLTVSRINKPLADSPASVSVIDRQMIRNSGVTEIADIFRMVPGFLVGHLQNNRPVVTYHGFGLEYPRQLQVLIDGRSVFVPSFGGVPWSNLPLLMEDIERIEIIRGPSSVTYGSNAFLATINIITRHAAEDLGGSVSVVQDLDKDSLTQNVYFRYGNQIDDLDWRITAGREKDDGFINHNDTELVEKFNFRGDFLTSYNQFWSIQAGINQGKFTHGFAGKFNNPIREEETENHFLNLKWELIEDNTQTTIKLTYTNQDVDDEFDVDTSGITGTVSFSRESKRTDLEIYQNRSLSEHLSINYGLSTRRDEVTSFYLFHDNVPKDIDTHSFFSSLEFKPVQDIIIDFGLLIEDTNLTRKEESYRLSIIKKINQHSLRLVTSSAVRNPILWELTGNITFDATVSGVTLPYEVAWLNSSDLISESIISHEIGIFSNYLDNQLSTDVKIFQYEISDQITNITVFDNSISPLDDGQYQTIINGGETQVEGVEFSFNYSPRHRDFRAYGGFSLLSSESFEQNLAHSVPDKSFYAGGHYQINPFQQLSTTYYTVDDFSWADRRDTIESYTKLDLRYQHTLSSKNNITLELIGQNLAEEYSDYRMRSTHEQSILIRLSGQF